MADEGLEGVARLMRRFDRMTPAVRAAVAPVVMEEARGMADQIIRIAPYDPAEDDGQHVRDGVRVEEGRLGDISAVVISDAKDAEGRPKAPRVELGHMAANGVQVPASPSFYPVVRASKKGVKKRIAAAARKAIRKEAGL